MTLPKPVNRELRRIRLYDTNNVQSVFYVVSELQNVSSFKLSIAGFVVVLCPFPRVYMKQICMLKQIAGQRYHPSAEVSKGRCRQIKKGFQQADNHRYYYSFVDKDEEEKKQHMQTPRLVVQMDTERSILDQKTCLDYYYEKPLQVSY